MEKVSEAVDCTMENNADGITVHDLGADPNVIFPGVESDFADENKLYGLSLTMDVSDDTEMATKDFQQIKFILSQSQRNIIHGNTWFRQESQRFVSM